jgi:DNA-binding response OmpR family regulator
MQDRDAANALPGGGNMSALNGVSPNSAQELVYATQQERTQPGSPGYILLVEDDTSLASLEASILTAHGYTVVIAADGERAILALEQSIPDLVVLDLELSGTMTGWDVLHTLRAYARTPVLLTSAETEVRKQIRSHGETRLTLDHLPKPYPMQTLLKRIERMLMLET